MDIFSHGLYGGVAFGRKSKREYLIAFFFGIAPDLFSFGILFFAAILGIESFPHGPTDPSRIPQFVHSLYDITHSFVIYGIFFALLWLTGKKDFAMLTLGWPLHIFVDMFTHSTRFFPTPFLWPLFDLQINGIPWSRPIIFIPNVVVILILYSYWYFKNKKKNL